MKSKVRQAVSHHWTVYSPSGRLLDWKHYPRIGLDQCLNGLCGTTVDMAHKRTHVPVCLIPFPSKLSNQPHPSHVQASGQLTVEEGLKGTRFSLFTPTIFATYSGIAKLTIYAIKIIDSKNLLMWSLPMNCTHFFFHVCRYFSCCLWLLIKRSWNQKCILSE